MCDVHAASNKPLCLLATSSWLRLADLSSILSRTAVDLVRNIASSALDVHHFCRHRRRPLCMYATSAIPSEEPNACAWPYPHGSDWVAHSPTAAVARCGISPAPPQHYRQQCSPNPATAGTLATTAFSQAARYHSLHRPTGLFSVIALCGAIANLHFGECDNYTSVIR
jgi:hypothetical protein